MNNLQDYEFRFRLDDTNINNEGNEEALMIAIKNNLNNLLNLVELRYNGQIVEVNQFNFINDDKNIYNLY